MAADLVTIIETVAVTQFLTPAAKNMGETVLERSKQLVGKAMAMLSAVGRQPQAVEEKLLVPLVQGASLETDPTLADLWAALLANAADPTHNAQVLPGFTGAMRELTSTDALILNQLYLPNGVLVSGLGNSLMQKQLVANLGISDDEATLSIENILRLRLCSEVATSISIAHLGGGTLTGANSVGVNAYGLAFMRACTPPAS